MGKLRLPRKKKKKLKKKLLELIKKGNSIRNKRISFICIDEIDENPIHNSNSLMIVDRALLNS